MAENEEAEESLSAVESAQRRETRHSRTFLDVTSEAELLSAIKTETKAGRLPSNVASGMEELYWNYKNAILQSGSPNADEIVVSNMTAALDRIFMDIEDPFVFSPYHKALRELSTDPAVIALLLETTNPDLAEKLTYIAGDRVVIDPLCKAFTIGRNLICVYSKKHMNDVPELAEMKRKANTRSLKEMAMLLRGGSQIIWIAPSGGRDRPDPVTGEWFPAPFDASALDNLRRLAEHSSAPGHINPLALLCHDIMPPPQQVEKEIGEKRMIAFHGTGLSVAPEIPFSGIAASCQSPEEAKEAYTRALYSVVTEQYDVLKSAIHGKEGLKACTPNVSLSQTWI